MVTKPIKAMIETIKYFCFVARRLLKLGPMLVFHHLANQVKADLRLYLFSSVSSFKLMVEVELLISNGETIELAAEAYPDVSFRAVRFVAKGLKFEQKYMVKNVADLKTKILFL